MKLLLHSPAEFQLYRIHSVLAHQGKEVSATIETINHFIALNSHKSQHAFFKTIENCLQQNQIIHYKQPVPLYTTAICESQILQSINNLLEYLQYKD